MKSTHGELNATLDLTFSLDGSSYRCEEHLCKEDDIDKSMDFLMDIFDERTSGKLKGIKLPENFITCLEVGFERLTILIELHDRQNVQIIFSGLMDLIDFLDKDRDKLRQEYIKLDSEEKLGENSQPRFSENKTKVDLKIRCYTRTIKNLQKIMDSDDVEELIKHIEYTSGMEPEYYTPLKYIEEYPENHPWWKYERKERRMGREEF